MTKIKQYKPGDRVYCEIYGTSDIVGATIREIKDAETEDMHGRTYQCKEYFVHTDGEDINSRAVMYDHEALPDEDPRIEEYELSRWMKTLPNDEILDWISEKVHWATLMGQKMTHVQLKEEWKTKFKKQYHETKN